MEKFAGYQNNRVMLFSPVRASADLVKLSLRSHAALHGVSERVYYDDCDQAVSNDLRAAAVGCTFLDKYEAGLSSAALTERSDYTDHQWTGARVSRIADIRNAAIKHFLASDCTHLFIVDADVICHPNQVTTLLAAAHPIVAAVYWTKFPGTGPAYMPNCWDVHNYQFRSPDSILRLREPGTYGVGGLGACTLIHRSVLEAGVNYSPIPSWSEWGEDRWFCMRAVTNGFGLWVDTNLIPYHVYQLEQLDEAQAWYNGGATDALVRTYWLTDKWRGLIENPPQIPFDQAAYERQLASEGRKPVLYVGQPGELFSEHFMAHWNSLFAYCAGRFAFVTPFNGYSSVAASTRQYMWEGMQALAATCHVSGASLRPTYILWLDDDNGLTSAQLETMMATLDADQSIGMVAAWTHIYRGDEPGVVSCGMLDENQLVVPLTEDLMAGAPSDLIEIDWSGFPAVLLRAECLEAAGDDAFIPYRNDKAKFRYSGEDVAFCMNLRSRSPYRIVVDRRLYVPHFKLRADKPSNPVLRKLACPSAVSGPVQTAV